MVEMKFGTIEDTPPSPVFGEEILKTSLVCSAVSGVTSCLTYLVGKGVGGIDYKTGKPYGAVANNAYGLMSGMTPGFGEAIKSFFGTIDDALTYIITWGY